jgi:hypothetical protein
MLKTSLDVFAGSTGRISFLRNRAKQINIGCEFGHNVESDRKNPVWNDLDFLGF